MEDKQTLLAPAPVLARYLELFRHAFLHIRAYGLGGGKDEALFCGLIADALHNVPDLLTRFDKFDQERLQSDIRDQRGMVPAQLLPAWDALFRGFDGSGRE